MNHPHRAGCPSSQAGADPIPPKEHAIQQDNDNRLPGGQGDRPDRPRSPAFLGPLRLHFSDDAEFLGELRERGPNLEPVVRVTFRETADTSGAPLTLLTLVAAYLRLVDDGTGRAPIVTLVQLAQDLGSVWTGVADPESEACRARGEELRVAIERAAGELGYHVARGAYLIADREMAGRG